MGAVVVDEETLRFYRSNAQAYAGREIAKHQRLSRFLALLPPGGTILELGCGAGANSAQMLAAGFDVRPTDGSPEMAVRGVASASVADLSRDVVRRCYRSNARASRARSRRLAAVPLSRAASNSAKNARSRMPKPAPIPSHTLTAGVPMFAHPSDRRKWRARRRVASVVRSRRCCSMETRQQGRSL